MDEKTLNTTDKIESETVEKMLDMKSWTEFRNEGLLWWINVTLHMFGWALVVNVDDDGNVTNAFPARTKFRGFDEKSTTEGYQKVTNFLKNNIDELHKEANS